MTPAERIAAALHRHATDHNLWSISSEYRAEPMPHDYVLDALCPKGERVAVDRSGPTDRLIRQQIVLKFGGGVLWVDIEEEE